MFHTQMIEQDSAERHTQLQLLQEALLKLDDAPVSPRRFCL